MLPAIEKGLKEHGVNSQNLAFIAVGIGPGSYTGIRVGAIAAKTLSYAWKLPLIGVCSLESFIPNDDCSFAAIIDAKIGGAYVMKGKKERGAVAFSGQPQVLELEKLNEFLSDVEALITPVSGPLKQKLQQMYPQATWKWEERAPDPMQMLEAAEANFKKGEYTLDGHLELLYLRKTQAEIEREKKQG